MNSHGYEKKDFSHQVTIN